MATWIAHLRIVENLLVEISTLDQVAFTFGSLAPDSGIPNADWTQFDPPKEITHFLTKGAGESQLHDMDFYRGYLSDLVWRNTSARSSFLLGYFFHLICDRLWGMQIGVPSKQAYAKLFAEHGKNETWDLIKNDWYGLDQRYVRQNPSSLFWRVLMGASNPPHYLPFVTEIALNHQIDYIRKFYSEPDADWVLDRPFSYLNEATMSRWIAETTQSLLTIYKRFDELTTLDGAPSALALLDASQIAPYEPPLGDVN